MLQFNLTKRRFKSTDLRFGKKQIGLSMIEMGLIFTVTAVAIAGIMYAYDSVVKARKYTTTVQQVIDVASGEFQYLAENSGKKDPLDLINLISQQYVGNLDGAKLCTTGQWVWTNPFGEYSWFYPAGTTSSDGDTFENDDGVDHHQFREQIYFPDEQSCKRFAAMLKSHLKLGEIMTPTDGTKAGDDGCYYNGDKYNVCLAFNANGASNPKYCSQ